MNHAKSLAIVTLCFGLLIGLAACGGEKPTPTPTTAAPAAAQPTTAPAETTAAQPAGGGETPQPQPLPTEPAAPAQAPTEAPTEGGGAAAAPEGTLAEGNINSYRSYSLERDDGPDGPISNEALTEIVYDPLAMHHKITEPGGMGMEIIIVGDTFWTQLGGMPWRKSVINPEEWDTALQGTQEMAPSVQLEEVVPEEDDIAWLRGQSPIKIAEGSLTPAGEETVNEVPCLKYTVDSTYGYTQTMSAPISMTARLEYQTQGEIWVANKAGWSPFVVRARLTEAVTTRVQGGAVGVTTTYLEQDITDINSPDIVILPPET